VGEIPFRVRIDGHDTVCAPPYDVFGPTLGAFGPRMRSWFDPGLTAELQTAVHSAVLAEAPEIARAYTMVVAIAQDAVIIELTSRSAVDRLADLGQGP